MIYARMIYAVFSEKYNSNFASIIHGLTDFCEADFSPAVYHFLTAKSIIQLSRNTIVVGLLPFADKNR